MTETPRNNRIAGLARASSHRESAPSPRRSNVVASTFHPNGGLAMLVILFLTNLLDLVTRLAQIDLMSPREAVLIALQSGLCIVLGACGLLTIVYRGSPVPSPGHSQVDDPGRRTCRGG